MRSALVLLAATLFAVSSLAFAQAKGPLEKVTLSGGTLESPIDIQRSELRPFDSTGYFADASGPVQPAKVAGQSPYSATFFTAAENGEPQATFSGDYFPANDSHPALLETDGKLWPLQPALGTLLDEQISSALTAQAGPQSSDALEIPLPGTLLAVLIAGALVLFATSGAVLAFARR
jgi:hypothetical protein